MKNSGPLLTRRTVLAAASALALPGARAAAFPSRPIRFVVPFSAGGTTDVMARALQVPLEARLKQPIVVDNRGGAYGAIGSELVNFSKHRSADPWVGAFYCHGT